MRLIYEDFFRARIEIKGLVLSIVEGLIHIRTLHPFAFLSQYYNQNMPDFEHDEWLENQKKGKRKRESPPSSLHDHNPHKSPQPPEETDWLGNHAGDKDE